VLSISENELIQVIADFLEMGHVDNIVAMFRQDSSLYGLTGNLLRDERFTVRLGLAVLFEELVKGKAAAPAAAIPSLLPLLGETDPTLRGEASNILGIINTAEALHALKPLLDDPDPQVAEIVADILGK
jgi:hypothetical protein